VSERKTALQTSAGGVVYRRCDDGQVEVALIATLEGERWGLPKGAVRKAETPEEAALREVAEETGLSARVVDKLKIGNWQPSSLPTFQFSNFYTSIFFQPPLR